MSKQVLLFKEAIIFAHVSMAMVKLVEPHPATGGMEANTSKITSPPTTRMVSEFETLNTIYRGVDGATAEDFRVETDPD